jgi:hypothetical protein
LGSYAGYWGGRIGNAVDEAIGTSANYYAATTVGSYLGYPEGDMGRLGTLAAMTGVSMLGTFLWSQGKRLVRATYSFLGTRSEFELGVISWREGKWNDAVGHTSVALIQDGKVLKAYGLSPDPLPDDLGVGTLTRLCLPGGGQVMDDLDMLDDHEAYIEVFGVNERQWRTAKDRIHSDRANSPTYSLVGLGGASCSSWALSVLRSAGVSGGSFMSRYLLSLPREIMLYGSKPMSNRRV